MKTREKGTGEEGRGGERTRFREIPREEPRSIRRFRIADHLDSQSSVLSLVAEDRRPDLRFVYTNYLSDQIGKLSEFAYFTT